MMLANLREKIQVVGKEENELSIARKIVKSGEQDEAFHVFDIRDIVKKYEIWKQAFPRVQPYYAIKCNDKWIIAKTLAALGAGFDCASKSELDKAIGLGTSPDRIIYANTVKSFSYITHASKLGIKTMTFDNESELYKIKELFPDAKLVLRIRCDDPAADFQFGVKFGCDHVTEAPTLLKLARDLKLNVIGVSFHIGSGCGNSPIFRTAINNARKIFDYASTLGYNLNFLDLGGGFPGNKGDSIDYISDVVNKALNDFFPDPSVKIIAEPGRFFVASASIMVCNIHSKKQFVKGTGETHNMYYVNDGIYGSFSTIVSHKHPVYPSPLLEVANNKLICCSIFGPTCDSMDQITDNALLPDLNPNDWIMFANMGAYTLPSASTFNGFPVPKVHYIANTQTWNLLKNKRPLTEDDFIQGNDSKILRFGLE